MNYFILASHTISATSITMLHQAHGKCTAGLDFVHWEFIEFLDGCGLLLVNLM